MINPIEQMPTNCELKEISKMILKDQFSFTMLPDGSSRWVPIDYSSEFMVEGVAKASDAYIGDQHMIGMIIATLKLASNFPTTMTGYQTIRRSILNDVLSEGENNDIVTLTNWAMSSDVRLQMIAKEHKYEDETLQNYLRRCRDLETKIIVQETLDRLEDYIIINR